MTWGKPRPVSTDITYWMDKPIGLYRSLDQGNFMQFEPSEKEVFAIELYDQARNFGHAMPWYNWLIEDLTLAEFAFLVSRNSRPFSQSYIDKNRFKEVAHQLGHPRQREYDDYDPDIDENYINANLDEYRRLVEPNSALAWLVFYSQYQISWTRYFGEATLKDVIRQCYDTGMDFDEFAAYCQDNPNMQNVNFFFIKNDLDPEIIGELTGTL